MRVEDVRRGEALFDAVERIDRVGRRAVVVALERLDVFGGGADDGDVGEAGFQRKHVVLILQAGPWIRARPGAKAGDARAC